MLLLSPSQVKPPDVAPAGNPAEAAESQPPDPAAAAVRGGLKLFLWPLP